MKLLSKATLSSLPATVTIPDYNLDDVQVSILHFGVGNFHRAHQAVYADNLLRAGNKNSGIIGVSLRSPNIRDELIQQNYLYTVATLGAPTEYRVIGAIRNILVAPENPQQVIAQIANENISLITTTITEKAYYLKSGNVDTSCDALEFDLKHSSSPQTVYGFIAAGIVERYKLSGSPITILCCDNINKGGEKLREGVSYLLKTSAPFTYQWMLQHVSFISSMVDRITPATSTKIRIDTMKALTVKDTSPVPAERYLQWVIEDEFISPVPKFSEVGAILVNDVTEYETVKLRFLNAAHSILATIGYLFGDEYIHETMQRKEVKQLTEYMLREELASITNAPKGIDLPAYIDETLTRFAQAKIPYKVLQVGSDTSLKIQQRWFPAIDLLLEKKQSSTKFAFILAAWVVFIELTIKNNTMIDPAKEKFIALNHSSNQMHITNMLTVANANNFNFFLNTDFIKRVTTFYDEMRQSPVLNLIIKLNQQAV